MQNTPGGAPMGRETVVGVFHDHADAERAIQDLRAAGFRDDQIGLLTPHGTPGVEVSPAPQFETRAGAGAVAGAVVGGVLGAAVALLIPGIGPVVAGGILATALGGGAVGALAGGIIGALVGMGIPEEEARYYEGEFKLGRTLVTVRADGRYDEARGILRRDGAYDVHEREPATFAEEYVEHVPPPVGDLAPAMPPVQVPPPLPATAAPVQSGQQGRIPYISRPWNEAMPTYRNAWQQRFGNRGQTWEQVEPTYRFGHNAVNNPRYQGRAWGEVEPQLHQEWEAQGNQTPWEQVREYVIVVWQELPRAA